MARICPNCGRPAIDEQSQFCNKCGSPFSEDQPKKVVVRTTPRLVDSPPVTPAPPAPPSQPVPEPPVVQQPATTVRPNVRVPPKRPARAASPQSPILPFGKYIARDFIKPVYWIGVIAILLVVFSGISAEFAKTDAATEAATETESDASDGALLSAIPLFWIGVMVIANLFWRVLCETSAMVFALSDAPAATINGPGVEQDWLSEEEIPGYSGGGATDEMIACPRCGKIVPAEELETCDICGVQGCSSCVRKMGLLKSKWICRDCFEKK